MINKIDLVWASGLFEGEGCFTLCHNKDYQNCRAVLISTDEDVVRRFAKIIGFGKVNFNDNTTRRNKKWKPQWSWTAYTFEEVQALIAFFWVQLGNRRKKRAKEILTIMKNYYLSSLDGRRGRVVDN